MSEERRHLHLAAVASAAVRGLDPVGVAEVYDAERGHVAVKVIDADDRTWLVEEAVSVADAAAEDITAPLLERLDARLPFRVPRPEGSAVVKGLGRVTVTRWVEDRRISFDDLPPGPGLAAEIGRTLAAVHNLDPAMYDDAGVPTYDAEAYRRRRLSELDRAAATGHVPARLLARWEQALELVPLWRFAATPVHGSFDGDALRVRFSADDVSTGRVTAVTGWGAAKVADPADDFAALYEAAHPDTFDSVLEAYANARHERPDRGLETRARLAAELDAVSALLRAHAVGDKAVVDELAGYLRVLDRETADHPLVQPRPEPTRPEPAVVPAEPAPAAPVRPAEPTPAPAPQWRTDTRELPVDTGRTDTRELPVHDAGSTHRPADETSDDGPELLLPPSEHTPESDVVDASDVLPETVGGIAATDEVRPARPAGSRPAATGFGLPVTGDTVEIPRER